MLLDILIVLVILALLPVALSVLYLIILLIGHLLKITVEAVFLPVLGVLSVIAAIYIYDNSSEQMQFFLQITMLISIAFAGIFYLLKQKKIYLKALADRQIEEMDAFVKQRRDVGETRDRATIYEDSEVFFILNGFEKSYIPQSEVFIWHHNP